MLTKDGKLIMGTFGMDIGWYVASESPKRVSKKHYREILKNCAGEKDLKQLLDTKGNSEVLADKMAREALNEFRGSLRR